MWNTPSNQVTTGVGTDDLFGGIEYARYIREDLSIAISFTGLEGVVGTATSSEGTFSGTAADRPPCKCSRAGIRLRRGASEKLLSRSWRWASVR
jgi:hypothetical protein